MHEITVLQNGVGAGKEGSGTCPAGPHRKVRHGRPTVRETSEFLRLRAGAVVGHRSRVQVFQGVVIRRQGGGLRETFTVRKLSYGVGVERIFPIHAPVIEKVELVRKGEVRRAKLYYLRDLRGKASKIKELRGDLAAAVVTEEDIEIASSEVVEEAKPVEEVVAKQEKPAAKEEVAASEPANETAEAPVETKTEEAAAETEQK